MGPLLFTIYVNNLGKNVTNVEFHFNAGDAVIYCCGSILAQSLQYLQSASGTVESWLLDPKLVLTATKTKLMSFSNARKT